MPDKLINRPIALATADGTASRLRDIGDGTFAEVMALPAIVPEVWSVPGTAFDVRLFSDVEVQFAGAPGTPYQPQRSLDGSTFVNCLAYDEAGNSYSTITAAGIYSFTGGGFLRFSVGAGSTLTRRAA